MSRDFSLQVAEAIHAAAIRVLRIVRVEDAKAGIGPAQLSALSVLVFLGPRTMGELATAEQVKAPTMSRIIQGLVEQGLAERSTNTRDRRAVQIAATSQGRKLLLAGRTRRVRALAKRMERLSSGDLTVLDKAARLLADI
ncbi:MAG TPA: MarR family transcriptional regulator [Terriglobales bacterium]|nr:MarR family transcriptional regulator [Terriglobales bacterium]